MCNFIFGDEIMAIPSLYIILRWWLENVYKVLAAE
jgi:hypothetical protein